MMKNKLLHLLILFYLSSSYLGAAHIHHDALAPHDDCKVCMVLKNIIGDVPPTTAIPDDFIMITDVPLQFTVSVFFTNIKGLTLLCGHSCPRKRFNHSSSWAVPKAYSSINAHATFSFWRG